MARLIGGEVGWWQRGWRRGGEEAGWDAFKNENPHPVGGGNKLSRFDFDRSIILSFSSRIDLARSQGSRNSILIYGGSFSILSSAHDAQEKVLTFLCATSAKGGGRMGYR